MKILLVYPPFYRFMGYFNRYFPYGLLTVATAVKHAGHDVRVYDADYNDRPNHIDIAAVSDQYDAYLGSFKDAEHPVWLEVGRTLRTFAPKVVGIQVYTDFAASAFHVAKMVKEMDPSCTVVMGGPHIRIKAAETLRICPDVDYAVVGEGEEAFVDLIRSLENGKTPRAIVGVWSREDGRIIENGSARLEGIGKQPMPDRSLLMNEKKYNSEDLGLMMTSRGCPYRCTYCITETRTLRMRPLPEIIEEIEHVKEKYKTMQFTFKDDTFTANKKRIYELCDRLMEKKIRINWECNARANTVDEPMLDAMKKAGCNIIKIGVETGSQRILDYMNKRITFEQIEKAAMLFRKVGIYWGGYFMMGVPGETKEDMLATVRFMKKIKPDFAILGTYQPYPGSEMFRDGVHRGLVRESMTYEDFFKTRPHDYYKKDPHRQVEGMDEDEFIRIEADLRGIFHQYNKNILRVIKLALTKLDMYKNEPGMILTDIKKYLSY